MSSGTILTAVVIAAFATILTIPLFASLTDRVGRRPVFMGGALFTALFAFPFFWLLQTGNPILITVSVVLALSIGWSAVHHRLGCRGAGDRDAGDFAQRSTGGTGRPGGEFEH